MKRLEKDEYEDIIKSLEYVEGVLRYTELDDESYLINHIKSYFMMKYNKIKNQTT